MQQSDYTDWNKQATVCLLMQSPPPRGAQLALRARDLLYIENYNVKVFVSFSISTRMSLWNFKTNFKTYCNGHFNNWSYSKHELKPGTVPDKRGEAPAATTGSQACGAQINITTETMMSKKFKY